MRVKFTRNKNKIFDHKTKKTTPFKSINRAKKESWILQQANGGLGRGSLVVK